MIVPSSGFNNADLLTLNSTAYPVSVSADESYENAFNSNAPTSGSIDQFSTLMARNPGGAIIDGAPHDGIPKAKKSFELSNVNFVAIAGKRGSSCNSCRHFFLVTELNHMPHLDVDHCS